MVQILFLGRLRDMAGRAEFRIKLAAPVPLSVVRQKIVLEAPELAHVFAQTGLRYALGAELVAKDADPMVDDDAELAIMPVFSGG